MLPTLPGLLLTATAVFGGTATAAPPRLLVVLVIDQMRAEFLARGTSGGAFERLRRDGAVFTQARHGHVPTETCPGHAAVLTGKYPSEHGIVSNDWWDRATRSVGYCAQDPLFGRSPRRLDSYTLGDALKARNPESKVVTVSVKDRAAIMLGGQRPDVATWFDKSAGDFATSGYYARPKWLDGLNKALRKKGAPLHSASTNAYTALAESPVGDELVLSAALEALKREKLGRDDAPDILGVSFSATDYVGHAHGGDGPEMEAQLVSLDKILARLLDALDARVGKGRWALALTADHGSIPKPSSSRGKAAGARSLTYVELEARLERALQYQYPSKSKWLEEEFFPHVWLSTSAAAATGLDRASLLRQAAKILAGVEDVAAAYVPGELPPDDPYARAYARVQHPRAGDLLLRLKPEVALAEAGNADHGSVYELDARVPLVFYGAGFARGTFDEPVEVIDLAPTAGVLLRVPFAGGANARALRSALAP